MYSNEDLERFYFRYQTEALPHGTSLQTFCLNNNVPYNIFSKWYKDTRRKVIEVQVQGRPNQKELSGEDVQGEKPVKKTASGSDVACNKVLPTNASELSEVRIWLELHFSNGLYLSRKNLNYQQLLLMVEKMEGLC